MSKVSIAILAAGKASRMGKPKQLLPYKKTTLLGHTIQIANASAANDSFCVIGAHANLLLKSFEKAPARLIINPNWALGLSSSIAAAVAHVDTTDPETEAILIILADQPRVLSSYLDHMIAQHKSHPNHVIASAYSDSLGVPALFPKEYWQDLLQLEGDKGAKMYLNARKEHVIALDAAALLSDIDTPEDYQQLIRSEI